MWGVSRDTQARLVLNEFPGQAGEKTTVPVMHTNHTANQESEQHERLISSCLWVCSNEEVFPLGLWGIFFKKEVFLNGPHSLSRDLYLPHNDPAHSTPQTRFKMTFFCLRPTALCLVTGGPKLSSTHQRRSVTVHPRFTCLSGKSAATRAGKSRCQIRTQICWFHTKFGLLHAGHTQTDEVTAQLLSSRPKPYRIHPHQQTLANNSENLLCDSRSRGLVDRNFNYEVAEQ